VVGDGVGGATGSDGAAVAGNTAAGKQAMMMT
jgi:hypothetical protein